MNSETNDGLEARANEQLEKLSSIKTEREEQREVIEKDLGKAGRKQFAPTYARLEETLAGLRAIRPTAKACMTALEYGQAEKLFAGPARIHADFLIANLRAAAATNYENAVLSAMHRIDIIASDDPRAWPRVDFAAGAIATLGFAQKLIKEALELLETIPAQAKPVKQSKPAARRSSKPASAREHPVDIPAGMEVEEA